MPASTSTDLSATPGARRGALEGLGLTTVLSLDTVAAADYYQQAIALPGTTGDPRIGARLHYRLALAMAFQGRGDESERHFRESMALARSLNDRSLMARILEEQAIAECFLGRFAAALKRGQESLALYQELNDRYPLPNAHLIVATILLHLGDWEGCRAHAEGRWRSFPGSESRALPCGRTRSAARSRWPIATMIWPSNTGWRPSASLARPKSATRTAPATASVGLAALLSGDPDQARRCLAESLVYFETGTMLYEMLLALLGVAFFLAHRGDEIRRSESMPRSGIIPRSPTPSSASRSPAANSRRCWTG